MWKEVFERLGRSANQMVIMKSENDHYISGFCSMIQIIASNNTGYIQTELMTYCLGYKSTNSVFFLENIHFLYYVFLITYC